MAGLPAAAGPVAVTPAAGGGTGWVRRLWGCLLRHRRDVVFAVGAAAIGSLAQALVPLVARQIIDKVVIVRSSPLWPWLLLLLAAALANFGFAYVRRYHGGRVAQAVQYDLRNAIHDHLLTLDLASLRRMPTGQLVARASSDTAVVQGLLSFLPLLSGNLLMMAVSLVIMFVLAPVLALVAVVVFPALVAVSVRMRLRVFPATWDSQQREGDVAQIVDEDVGGVRVVKAFGQEGRELDRLVGAASALYGSRLRAVRLRARYQPLLTSIPTFAQVAILALGGWLAVRGRISIGTFLAFSTYVAQFAAPARQLAGLLTMGQAARASVDRIFQLLDHQPAIIDAPGAVDLGSPPGPAGVPSQPGPAGQPGSSPVRGEVVFEKVTFAYPAADPDGPAGPPVLREFDLRIAAGERVALIGASGSGKSTVAMLLARFYDPDAGRVSIDGHDLRTVRLASLRRQLAFAFEDSFLFSDTVRANIAYGRPDATDAEIVAAAQAAAAHEFILDLPQGYDTVVGERGLSLSGGQRQRIALARAILANPRVLVLDDATSAVDASTEERIHDALREVLPGRTTLLVAHRMSTLRLADRVVVLDRGRVVDEGSHAELSERSAAYRSLLAGLEEEQEGGPADRVETLAAVTAAAWDAAAARRAANRDAAFPGARADGRGVSLGAGLGGSGGAQWRMSLSPTPELLAGVAKLPPVTDVPTVDLATESQPDPRFSLPRLLRAFRRPLLVGLLLVVIDSVAGLAGPTLVKTGIDEGVATGSVAAVGTAAAIFYGLAVLNLVDQAAQTIVTGRTAERIMLSLRIRIFAQLQRLSLDYYEREMSGRIMTRMTSDVDQFARLVENGLLAALVSAVTFVGVGIALLVMDVELGLLTLLVIIPLALATRAFRRRAARLYDLSRERLSIVNADFQESVSGVREAQAFAHEAASVARFHELGGRYLQSRVAAQRLVALYFPFVAFLSAVADAVVLGVGSAFVADGQLTAGALIAFLLYVDLFFSPIQQLSQVFDAWQQTRVSVGRIADLMRRETLTPPASHPVAPGRLRGELELSDVRFTYPGTDQAGEALRGVSLTVRAGETVALVGETGAGKSTVMKLLARFYDPDAGAVRVDGHDLRDLDLTAFRQQLGYVPQEPFLFAGSIRLNIAYGRPGATDAEVEAAARAVGAHDFIAALPGGYLHEVAERGMSLSAGQRQLIALARAELVDPAVLLLDEATSNLDLATEAKVAAAMRRVSRARTTVLIAHRLQTARAADRIFVLDGGRVAECGSHDELLAAGGRYAAMWRAFEQATLAAPAPAPAVGIGE
ncbi:MAG: ABC transporter ATP-binding protein [Frankia sp.]|nr:ABC transporter ATP-binding protein [Frankia sp.]